MHKKRLKEFKKKLQKRKEEILRNIKDIENSNLNVSQRDGSGDLSGYSIHLADVASDNYEREKALGFIKKEEEMLNEVEDALNLIETGEYGVCQSCGKNISIKRLEVKPNAKNCIKCQEQIENEKNKIHIKYRKNPF